MPNQLRVHSELTGGDPTLLNRIAWSRRWADRNESIKYANSARKTAIAGTGKRSRAEQGMALRTLAWQANIRGDFELAMTNCLSAETFLPESEHVEARATLYSTLGLIHFARNRFDLANCAVDRGFWLLKEVPETTVTEPLTILLLTRAIIQRHSGENARAGITLGRARELSEGEIGNAVDYCTAMWLLSDGDIEAAHVRSVEGLEGANALANRVIQPYFHALIGACEARMGRVDKAAEQFAIGQGLADADEDRRVQSILLREQAQMQSDCGDTDAALNLLKRAATLAKATGFAFERKRVAQDLAVLYEKTGDYKQAVEQHKLAWRLQSETRVR